MARIKLSLPQNFRFETRLPIRITDLNYGGHVGNDTILGLLHEARLQFLQQAGYSELNVEGVGLIMSDVAIEYKQELFYGDAILVKLVAFDFTRVGFDIAYQVSRANQEETLVALAKTGMVCYNYTLKKVAPLPPGVEEALGAGPAE